MRENPEEATECLITEGLNSGDFQKNLDYNISLQFGLTDELTEQGLRNIVEDYIRLGIITSTQDVEEVMDKVWTPTMSE